MSGHRVVQSIAALTLSAWLGFAPVPADAAPHTVTGLSARLRAGQIFLSWDGLAGSGWSYRVHHSVIPIDDAASLAASALLGVQRDSSAVDRRRTKVMRSLQTFRVDSAAAPLESSAGLFVRTLETSGLGFYAVLAESSGGVPDPTIVLGANSLVIPVPEWPEAPLPIWKRHTIVPADGDDYVLWVNDVDTPTIEAMANRPSTPTHLTLRRGLPGRPLVLYGHSRGGNSYQSLLGSGYPGESILCIEDHLPTGDHAGFAFGYGQDDDPAVYWNASRPPGGIVIDYVERRVRYVLDWSQRVLLPDPQRLYVWGGSMGGSLAFFLAYHEPDRVAASMGVIPKLSTAYTPDSFLDLRVSFDRIWGRIEDTPMGSHGIPVFDWMDGRWLAEHRRVRGAAPHSMFFGRADTIVGWPEKVAYAQAMQTHRIGGALFWDTWKHFDDQNATPWRNTQTTRRMHAFRLDRSFSALSRCSADGDMGDGSLATGDTMGTINGFLDWDTTMVDLPDRWECTLRTVSLPHRDGVFAAPDSARVDVTPRRVQQFLIAMGVPYSFEVHDVVSGALLESGERFADGDALLTIERVPVTASGSRLTITHATTSTPGSQIAPRGPSIRLAANPLRRSTQFRVAWPISDEARVRLIDAAGRVIRLLHQGPVGPLSTLFLDTGALAPGLYWIEARQGDTRGLRRIVVLR